MRRLVLLVVGCSVALLAGSAVPALGDGGPHVSGAGLVADGCAACHRAHTADARGLLKESQEDICYTCHGAGGTGSSLDVQSGIGYDRGETGALRGGGFDYALIDSGSPTSGTIPALDSGQATTSTHSINATDKMLWGNGEISGTDSYGRQIQLRCGNCHDPHGNGMYRILRPTPKDAIENLSHGDHSYDVELADAGTKVYTTTNFWDPDYADAPDFKATVSGWCANCHTRYLAPNDSGKTDSGDAVFTYRHAVSGQHHRPACSTCHVAHGSNASMGTHSSAVPLPDGSSDTGSRLLRADNRGVCQQCHGK